MHGCYTAFKVSGDFSCHEVCLSATSSNTCCFISNWHSTYHHSYKSLRGRTDGKPCHKWNWVHGSLPNRFLHMCAWCSFCYKEQDCLKKQRYRDHVAAATGSSSDSTQPIVSSLIDTSSVAHPHAVLSDPDLTSPGSVLAPTVYPLNLDP